MSGSHVCTQASHAAIKADRAAWDAIAKGGFSQRFEAGSDGVESWPAYDLVQRHCAHCKSTLAIEVPVADDSPPDCRACDGSGHGEQRSVDSFARCTTCLGTGHAVCAFCCERAAHRVVGDHNDPTCRDCDERLGDA